MKLDVVFVCQQGELEPMSCLLAASLRARGGEGIELHVIEPVPLEEYGLISDTTRRFLDGLGVRWYRFENPISHDYKIFNKLNAFRIQPRTERILFLDSDIYVRGALDGLESFFRYPFVARAANKQRFSGDARDWQPAYGLFGLPVPSERWPATDTGEWGPPYFNAGVILVDPALDYSAVWSETCRRIHETEEIWQRARSETRGTVQVGMPVALYRQGTPYALLDGRYHFSLNRERKHARLAWGEEQVLAVHYGEWSNVLRDKTAASEVSALIQDHRLSLLFDLAPEASRFAAALHAGNRPAKRSVIRASSLLEAPGRAAGGPRTGAPYPHRPSTGSGRTEGPDPTRTADPNPARNAHAADLLVLGIPGSGAAIVASAFGALRLEEPARLLEENGPSISGPVWVEDSQAPRLLLRLRRLLKARKDLRVLTVVRDPYEAIAAWWDVPEFWTGAAIDDAAFWGDFDTLPEDTEARLTQLRRVEDASLRRAGLWELLATAANHHHPRVRILRYEDWGPSLVTAALAEWAHVEPAPGVLTKSALRYLDGPDAEAVENVCSFIAGAFCYNLHDSRQPGATPPA